MNTLLPSHCVQHFGDLSFIQQSLDLYPGSRFIVIVLFILVFSKQYYSTVAIVYVGPSFTIYLPPIPP